MKTIGIIGGISWVSTIDYYKLINQLTNQQLGGSHAAQIILYSLNFQEFKSLLDADDWVNISKLFVGIAFRLKEAGADCIVVASNTPHLVADDIQNAVSIPLLHIADATAKIVQSEKLTRVALLGTKFVMDRSFFKDKLSLYGIETVLPNLSEKEFIHRTIFSELTQNIFTEETKDGYLKIIERLIGEGAEGIIYACTEIPILLQNKTVGVKTFDTSFIHAKAAVAFATEIE